MAVLKSLRNGVTIERVHKRGMGMDMYLMMWNWENMDDGGSGVENMIEIGIIHMGGEREDATTRNMNDVTETIVNEDMMTTETEIGIGIGTNDGTMTEIGSGIVIVIMIEVILIAIEIATEGDRCINIAYRRQMLQTPC
jgi:hypothetical protein